jgi:hypothetical protein
MLVVWSKGNLDFDLISARMFEANASPSGPQWELSDDHGEPAFETSPAVTSLGPARFLAAWEADLPSDASYGPAAQFIEHSGEQAADFDLGDFWPYPSSPSVAASWDGQWAAAWISWVPEEGGYRVFGRVFDASGVPVSDQIRVSQAEVPDGLMNDHSPQVGVDLDGRFVVAWIRDAENGASQRIMVRLLDPDFSPRSDEFRIDGGTVPDVYEPRLVVSGEGTFHVFWMGTTAEGLDVLAQRFEADGSPVGPSFVVNSYRPGGQLLGGAANDPAGNFVVAWSQGTDAQGRQSEIYARAFRADGTALSPDFHVNPNPIDDFRTDELPAVALSTSGLLAFAWQSWMSDGDATGIRAARFSLPCIPDEYTLCLNDGRFMVRSFYRTAQGAYGLGRKVELAGESGGFWFFGPENLELAVKVLDGCGVNSRHWVFATGLTDVEVELLVTDTWTGEVWRRVNPLGTRFPPLQEIDALQGCGAPQPDGSETPTVGAADHDETEAAASFLAGTCVPDETSLCLEGNRFRVSATFDSGTGLAGAAIAVPLTDESGTFWFFWQDNVELFVKVLDACAAFDRFWVFAGGLTNVSAELVVQDTVSGEERRYVNPLGTPFLPIQDASAFETCP